MALPEEPASAVHSLDLWENFGFFPIFKIREHLLPAVMSHRPHPAAFSLKSILKSKLFDGVFCTYKKDKNEHHMVLVMDKHSFRIVGSCCDLSQLVEHGFVALQDIALRREAVDLPALYFIEPTESNIRKLALDFDEGKDAKQKLKAKYLRAYVHSTGRLPRGLMESELGSQRRFVERCHALKEMNLDFESFESRVFLLNQRWALSDLLVTGKASQKRVINVLSNCSKQLASVCVALNELPNIRYRAPRAEGTSTPERYCQFLARFLSGDSEKEGDLPRVVKRLDAWKARENPATVLILDRETDPIAPLIHEVTYQASLYDHFLIRDEVVRVKEISKRNVESSGRLPDGKAARPAEKDYVLNETDKWWREHRHCHINELFAALTKAKEAFKKSNELAKSGAAFDEKDMSSKEMLKKVRDYPAYRDFTKTYTKHITILKQVFDHAKPLTKALLELEQDMATGLDATGATANMRSFFPRLLSICRDPEVNMLSKARVTMIYIITQGGMTSKNREAIFATLNPSVVRAINNLDKLGVHTGEPRKEFKIGCGRSHLDIIKRHLRENKQWAEQHWRYLPRLHDTVKQMLDGKLDRKKYPYIQTPTRETKIHRATVIRSKRKRQVGTRPQQAADKNPRFIVFVLGGVTLSEIRSVYALADEYGVDLVIGSTEILTASEYLKCLSLGHISKTTDIRTMAAGKESGPAVEDDADENSDFMNAWKNMRSDD